MVGKEKKTKQKSKKKNKKKTKCFKKRKGGYFSSLISNSKEMLFENFELKKIPVIIRLFL